MQKIATVLTLCLAVSLAGCETLRIPKWLGGTDKDAQKAVMLTEEGALGAFEPIPNSAKAPCVMQKSVAKHNSVYTSFKEKRLVTFKAPCDTPPPSHPAAKTVPPKTS